MEKKDRLIFEINVLRQHPVFQEYIKLMQVMENGQAMLEIISNKERMVNALSARREPYSHLKEQVMEEPPRPQRVAPPEMAQRAKQRPPITQERERELDKKVAMADADFEAPSAQDLGQEEDLELPDLDEE